MLIDFRQLFPRWNIKPTGVLHVGGNIGEEAPVYLELGIKRQVWVEANPYICQRLSANVASNPEAKVYNFAATDQDGQVILHESNNGSQSSSILELGTHKIAHPEVHYVRDIPVQGLRLDSFVNGEFDGLDFLNMDIQGAELMALRGMGDLLRQFKWAYLEVNKESLYTGCALFPEIEYYMNTFGFNVKEIKWCGNTGWGDCFMSKD
jgi:FkbM family methyltransferase